MGKICSSPLPVICLLLDESKYRRKNVHWFHKITFYFCKIVTFPNYINYHRYLENLQGITGSCPKIFLTIGNNCYYSRRLLGLWPQIFFLKKLPVITGNILTHFIHLTFPPAHIEMMNKYVIGVRWQLWFNIVIESILYLYNCLI